MSSNRLLLRYDIQLIFQQFSLVKFLFHIKLFSRLYHPSNCRELSWTPLNCRERHWTVVNAIELSWTPLNCRERHWTVMNATEPSWHIESGSNTNTLKKKQLSWAPRHFLRKQVFLDFLNPFFNLHACEFFVLNLGILLQWLDAKQ
jgi:hypothetical protein